MEDNNNDERKKIAKVNRPKRKRDYNTPRRKERQSFYNTGKWKALRTKKMQDQPICENCYYNGQVTPAEDIHHIQSPFLKGYTRIRKNELMFDYNNLMSLCKRCHSDYHNNKIKKLNSKKYEQNEQD